MVGWSLTVQRGFGCGLLHSSSAASLHTAATSSKATTSICVDTYGPQFDLCQSVEVRASKELLHSTNSILQYSTQEGTPSTYNMPQWKMLKEGEHGIGDKSIPTYAWKVLQRLQEKGHEVYLVGGSVRDMLLKQVPKDFDVITTAQLKQVKHVFPHAFIVGKRFPVCHVHINDKVVEVSSFSTVANIPGKYKVPIPISGPDFGDSKKSTASFRKHRARWENSMRRDFTINGLLYNPFEKTVYDYLGGVEDLTRKKVRTVTPASLSFSEDSARILRALRIAARLGFKFSRETAQAIQRHSGSINNLNQERLRLEVNNLMSYGASEPSIRLLWRFGLLEILFPAQAAYFAGQGFKRQDKISNMLLLLLGNLDKLITPAKPCHCTLWINLLALHLALLDNPQSPVVVTALALTIHGKDLGSAVLKAIKLNAKYGGLVSFPELMGDNSEMTKARIKRKVLQLCKDSIRSLNLMASSEYVSNAMSNHPEAPCSSVVMLTKQLLGRSEELFLQVSNNMRKSENATEKVRKRSINRAALLNGSLEEVSFVFGHIVLTTLYPKAGKRKVESSSDG